MTLPLPCRVRITGLGRPWTASAGIGAQLPYPVPATPRREFSLALPLSFSILFHRPGCGGPGLGQSSLVCPRGLGHSDDLTRSPTPRDDSAGVGGISVMTRIGVAAEVPLAGWREVVNSIPRWGDPAGKVLLAGFVSQKIQGAKCSGMPIQNLSHCPKRIKFSFSCCFFLSPCYYQHKSRCA